MVSGISATYNMGQYIAEAIESISRQTSRNWELFIIDDGSSDYTSPAVRPYLSDPKMMYWEQEGAGQAVVKNAGIRNPGPRW